MKLLYTVLLALLMPILANATPTISGVSFLCVGTSSTLVGTPSGGTWSTSTPSIATIHPVTGVITGITPGSAVIIYTDTTSSSATITITVMSAPSTPSSVTGSSTVAVGGTITLSCATSGGSWTTSSASIASVVAATGVVRGVSPGTATISYTVTNSCGSASSTRVVTVYGSTNVTEIEKTAAIKIFPNPTNGQLNISCETPITGDATVVISNVTGEKVLSKNVLLNNVSLDLSSLGNGIYFITIKADGVDYRNKIEIAH